MIYVFDQLFYQNFSRRNSIIASNSYLRIMQRVSEPLHIKTFAGWNFRSFVNILVVGES